jgi:hypothetical protein
MPIEIFTVNFTIADTHFTGFYVMVHHSVTGQPWVRSCLYRAVCELSSRLRFFASLRPLTTPQEQVEFLWIWVLVAGW